MMNWDAVGSVAETIGALGIILSLIYRAIKICNQNRQARLDVINELTRQRNEYSGNLVDNGEFAEIWVRGINDYQGLNDVERVRASSHLSRMVCVMESLHEHRQANQLKDESWEAYDRYIKEIFLYPSVQQWSETRSFFFAESFQAHVDQYIGVSQTESPNLYLEGTLQSS